MSQPKREKEKDGKASLYVIFPGSKADPTTELPKQIVEELKIAAKYFPKNLLKKFGLEDTPKWTGEKLRKYQVRSSELAIIIMLVIVLFSSLYFFANFCLILEEFYATSANYGVTICLQHSECAANGWPKLTLVSKDNLRGTDTTSSITSGSGLTATFRELTQDTSGRTLVHVFVLALGCAGPEQVLSRPDRESMDHVELGECVKRNVKALARRGGYLKAKAVCYSFTQLVSILD
jgi:hypothetical protein